MIIRAKQIDTFRTTSQRSFEDQMILHLSSFSPPLFKATGEAQMREAIRLGMSKAEAYGFDRRGPVQLYLEMMLLFGSHFDNDPQYEWSAEILNDREAGTEMERAEMLYKRTMHYRESVAGPEDKFTLQALRNIRIWADQPLPLSRDKFIPSMLEEIQRVYPQKADYVGRDALETLIHHGGKEALAYGFATARAVALMIILMLAFGHGCGSDPLYPWIARTLNDEAITDPAARAKRLENKALTWLDHVLAYFDKRTQT
jgi:hypothetical protein